MKTFEIRKSKISVIGKIGKEVTVMLKMLLRLYGVDVVLSLSWLGKVLLKEKIRDKQGLPSVFNDLYDDYLKY